ncbi:MAG: glycosyltransferase [Chlamydiae bacterium]|nr:glycosyltransferase [Chlamydiota bacterium]
MPWTFWFDVFFLWYFSIINGFYTFVLILGMLRTYIRRKEITVEDYTHILRSDSFPTICFIVPMYNEKENIFDTLKSILNLTYRYKRIIAVNDGSEDATMDVLIKNFELLPIPLLHSENIETAKVRKIYQSKTHPEIIVIDKEHRGKFDAINAGLNACTDPFFLVADADSFIDDPSFQALIRPIFFDEDTVGVGATIRIRNGCFFRYNQIDSKGFPDQYLSGMQGAEYLRTFYMRQGLDWVGGNFLIAGAFSVFSTPLIRKLGGFCNTAGEDVEIVVRIHRALKESKLPYKIVYLPDPVSWTEAPSTWRSLARQRIRWHFGLLESIWIHKKIHSFRPIYGLFGWIIFPFMVWGEALQPIIEIIGYIYIIITWHLGILNLPFFVLFLTLSFGFVFVYSTICLLIEALSFRCYSSFRTIILLLASCLLENIGYRQLSVLWKLAGFLRFFKKFPKVRKETKRIKQLIRDFSLEQKHR